MEGMKLDYWRAETATPTADLIDRVIEQFPRAGCRVLQTKAAAEQGLMATATDGRYASSIAS
jgi:hypothetical protein